MSDSTFLHNSLQTLFKHVLHAHALWCMILIGCIASTFTYAQGSTDLFVFQLHKTQDYAYHAYQPRWLSGFNPGGYTNQPWFTPTGDILVSIRKSGEIQNDIYQLSLYTRKVKRITQTSANEFSPRWTPNRQNLTVVRQVEGDSIDQQIFQTALNGGGFKSMTPGIRDIGYYAWMDDDQLALFRIESTSNRLVSLNLKDKSSRKLTTDVGRSLYSDGKGKVTFVHKFSPDYWYLKTYDYASRSIAIIVQTPGESEDFAIDPTGTYFMGVGSKLYCFHPEDHATWHLVSDLSIYGITNISRLAISPDGKHLALVSQKETE